MKDTFVKLYRHVSLWAIFYVIGLLGAWAFINVKFIHWNGNQDWAFFFITVPVVLFLMVGLPFYDKYKPVPPLAPIVLPLNINETAKLHHAWVVQMGWGGQSSPLEQLALVTSEIGEAVNEARGKEPTENFKYEVADIMLRAMSIAERYNFDLEKAISEKMEKNRARGNKGRIK